MEQLEKQYDDLQNLKKAKKFQVLRAVKLI